MTDRIERFTVPTLEQLAPLKSNVVDDDTLVKIRDVLQRCQNGAIGHEDALKECDMLLENYGLEALNIENDDYHTDDGIRMCPAFTYSNAGDTYNVTLARDHVAGEWVVASWGDLLEEYQEENELGDHEVFDECPERCPSCHDKEFELKHFAGSGRGPSYSWICKSCQHHCFASDKDGAVKIGETDDYDDVYVKAVDRAGVYSFDVVVDGVVVRDFGATAEDARNWWKDGK